MGDLMEPIRLAVLTKNLQFSELRRDFRHFLIPIERIFIPSAGRLGSGQDRLVHDENQIPVDRHDQLSTTGDLIWRAVQWQFALIGENKVGIAGREVGVD